MRGAGPGAAGLDRDEGLIHGPCERRPDMHRSELEATVPCAGCGAAVAAESRCYEFGDTMILCWDCAISRGGAYDAKEDRWTTQPRTNDLPEE